MNFSQALENVKIGKKAQREGWNGKRMYIRYLDPHNDSTIVARDNHAGADGTPAPFIAMKTADNKLVPWLASQTDILADDWKTLE